MVYDDNSNDINRIFEVMKLTKQKKTLQEDDYYNYYKSLITNSSHYCHFSNVRLVKSVDEAWVEAIEKAIPAITNCIRNPRKYIEEEREVVNIAMARNITTESLRHLLQHSNYIDEYRKDGTVIPNRILNIYKEESMNTYENRFVCTLLMELQHFVNKRYDAIFEASKDELGTSLEMSSTIQNYTELMDYNLTIKIRDKQTDIENEMDNKDVFARIEVLHRTVNMLVTTEFISTMKRFPQVHHPIVKTNAIKKNQDYKECYELWDFLHTYQNVGYQVNLLKQSPNIPLNFEEDLYDSIFYHYAMMHCYAEGMDVISPREVPDKRNITMDYIRSVLEEIVSGMDLSDENMKKLIMTELTEIQRRRRKEKEDAERINRKKKKSKGMNNEKPTKKKY